MRSNRPYVQIDPDVLEQARQIDLLSYLRAYEPSNLVKVKGTTNVYCTAEHDSLKISKGKWYWWSRGFGGYSALDYLMKVKEYGFVEAVETLTGQTMADWKPPPSAVKKNEPRKLALDQRLINNMLPDNDTSKAATYVSKAFEIWEQTKEQKSAQLIFCDLSTPKGDGTFNVYEDIKNKLVGKGVPPEEIAFIHEGATRSCI